MAQVVFSRNWRFCFFRGAFFALLELEQRFFARLAQVDEISWLFGMILPH